MKLIKLWLIKWWKMMKTKSSPNNCKPNHTVVEDRDKTTSVQAWEEETLWWTMEVTLGLQINNKKQNVCLIWGLRGSQDILIIKCDRRFLKGNKIMGHSIRTTNNCKKLKESWTRFKQDQTVIIIKLKITLWWQPEDFQEEVKWILGQVQILNKLC